MHHEDTEPANRRAAFEARLAAASPLSAFRRGVTVRGASRMALRPGYAYALAADPLRGYAPGFTPDLSPADMLAAGVFEGAYLNDATAEFPREWLEAAHRAGRLAVDGPRSAAYNAYGVAARAPLRAWREAGWVPSAGTRSHRSRSRGSGKRAILADPVANPDERGWFQWYARYALGRRLPDLDAVQIARWRNFGTRHRGALRARCTGRRRRAAACAPRERQALLQWGYA